MDRTDAELLAGSARDPEAFAIFYDRYAERLPRQRIDDRARRRLQIERVALDDASLARIEELAALRAVRATLSTALDELSPATARAVALRVTEELPFAEVPFGSAAPKALRACACLTPTTHVGRWSCVSHRSSALVAPNRPPTEPPRPPDISSHYRLTPEVLHVRRSVTDELEVVVGRARGGRAAQRPPRALRPGSHRQPVARSGSAAR
jgi:hypothetical protein